MARAREKLWVVRAGDGQTIGDILARAKEPAAAVDDGRVFVGKKRVTRVDHAVRVGEAVRIGPAPETAPDVTILLERDGLVACVKPAGLPTVPDQTGSAHALVALVAKAIRRPVETLRVTSRLDRDVSGVVVFALDASAEERLKRARAEGRYRRRYVALAAMKETLPETGRWDAAIGRAADPRLRLVNGPDAKESRTQWARIAVASGAPVALLAVDPVTGRTHQIRVHAAHAEAPLVGDRDYGGPTRFVLESGRILSPSRIALHALRVTVPGVREVIDARAPVPAELRELWRALGGEEDAWDSALRAQIG